MSHNFSEGMAVAILTMGSIPALLTISKYGLVPNVSNAQGKLGKDLRREIKSRDKVKK